MLRELIYETRSYRSFDESCRLTKEQILAWIDIARLTPSAKNLQPLKYKVICTREGVEKILPLTHWAGALSNIVLPPDGHHPSAFIIICNDGEIQENIAASQRDVGIAAMTLLMAATEDGYGGCMIGAFEKDRLGEVLRIPERYTPTLLIALGKPDENVFLTEPGTDGSVAYFRDSHNLHFVPKRKLTDVVLE